MKVLAKIKCSKSSFKKVCCCGCYFDKVCYILNSNHLISYETFEGNFNADWYFVDFTSGFIVIVCDDVFSPLSKEDEQQQQQQQYQNLVIAFEQLYEFELL